MPAWQVSSSSSSAASSTAAAAVAAAAARAGSRSGTSGGRGSSEANKEEVLFEDVVKELHALTQAPRQSGSLRSATDAALRRLQVNCCCDGTIECDYHRILPLLILTLTFMVGCLGLFGLARKSGSRNDSPFSQPVSGWRQWTQQHPVRPTVDEHFD